MSKPIISGPYRTFRRLNPYESFVEFEGSTITIPMKARRSAAESWMEDEIKLKAFMRLELYPPYVNNLGTREFQFTIRDWDLYGSSPMLNQLFFDDPRGHWVTDSNSGISDYVSAQVTFNVANHFEVGIDSPSDILPDELFSSANELEIRNITSHHFRIWAQIPEHEMKWLYTLPGNRIYWQIINHGTISGSPTEGWFPINSTKSPLIIFHKKPPQIGVNATSFDATDEKDVAQYLLAAAVLKPSRSGRIRFTATQSVRGFRANEVQLPGNTVISTQSRQREPLQISWALSRRISDIKELDELLSNAKKSGAPLGGWIQMVTPSRSVGTADQAPEVGYPSDSEDLPARITYAINYNIFLNKERFVEDQAGVALAVGAEEIPPKDVTVAFDKPHIGHVLSRFLEFDAGHCTGMHEISESEYLAGLNFCRYWRTVPLDPTSAEWGQYEDFDPGIPY